MLILILMLMPLLLLLLIGVRASYGWQPRSIEIGFNYVRLFGHFLAGAVVVNLEKSRGVVGVGGVLDWQWNVANREEERGYSQR